MIIYTNEWFAGHVALLFLIIGSLGIILFFLPSFIAFSRQHPYRLSILLLNFLFGWTGIAWIGLFIWAIAEPRNAFSFNGTMNKMRSEHIPS